QNGFGAEQDLAALLPGVSILAGLCFISCFQDGPARVRHTGHGRLSLAPLTPGDPQAAAIAAVFAGCGVETETLPAAEAARLRKLVWNIPYNGLSVLADCLTDTLASAPPLLAAVQVIMEEVIEAAAACGVEIPRSFADEMKETIRNMPGSSPSMRLDWLNHRPLETEAIYGRVIAYAAAHGYDMKYARLLQAQLEYQESLYAG
ncbi:MAG: 2-dehydropantoate 2-reductase, partial [Propionibacteriaceae bacterium]|nr:2-dehydropantoate 2-reductase [Propionibacteriaceae bacterium]